MPSKALADADPLLVELFRRAWDAYEREHPGHRIKVDCTHRTAEEQFELYRIGRVPKDHLWVVDDDPRTQIVTQVDGFGHGLSHHNPYPSRAIDFHLEVSGKALWDPLAYVPFGVSLQEAGLLWGGTWGAPATLEEVRRRIRERLFVDACHVELPQAKVA